MHIYVYDVLSVFYNRSSLIMQKNLLFVAYIKYAILSLCKGSTLGVYK